MQEKTANLALVASGTTFSDALQIMQRSGHSSIVVQTKNGGYLVLTDSQIFAALRQNSRDARQPISNASGGRGPTFIPAAPTLSRSGLASDYSGTFPYALDTSEGDYGVVAVRSDRATVVSTDPLISDSFYRQAAICRCRLHPDTHIFQPQELEKPGVCNLDPSAVDCSN